MKKIDRIRTARSLDPARTNKAAFVFKCAAKELNFHRRSRNEQALARVPFLENSVRQLAFRSLIASLNSFFDSTYDELDVMIYNLSRADKAGDYKKRDKISSGIDSFISSYPRRQEIADEIKKIIISKPEEGTLFPRMALIAGFSYEELGGVNEEEVERLCKNDLAGVILEITPPLNTFEI